MLSGALEEAFEGNINEEILGRIEKMKMDHRNVLTAFRSDFEGSFKREQHVRQELKQKVRWFGRAAFLRRKCSSSSRTSARSTTRHSPKTTWSTWARSSEADGLG